MKAVRKEGKCPKKATEKAGKEMKAPNKVNSTQNEQKRKKKIDQSLLKEVNPFKSMIPYPHRLSKKEFFKLLLRHYNAKDYSKVC